MFRRIAASVKKVSLIKQIALGLIVGILIAVYAKPLIPFARIFGDLFVNALKGTAPLLVFILVLNSMAQRKQGQDDNMKPIIILYMFGTFAASLVSVVMSFLFPVSLQLSTANVKVNPPSGIVEVLYNLVMSLVDNPVHALMNANYIGILAWALVIGVAFHFVANGSTKVFLDDSAKAFTKVVTWIIHFAPIGIMGLVANSVGTSGVAALLSYVKLLGVLLGSYFFVAFIMNPAIVFFYLHINPYPLVWTTLRESGLYAFFTRSSAANIPVNLSLCKRLGLNPDTYTISIPLGATINMAGAAITITVLSLAAAHTLGLQIDIMTALLLSIVSTIGACGSSGVAGGSLLLIPVACASFGIGNDFAMQVVGVGFIIAVLEDACETALNSSSDVLFTATADLRERRLRQGKITKADLVPKDEKR